MAERQRLGIARETPVITDVLKGLSDLHAAQQAVHKGERRVKDEQMRARGLEVPITFVVKPSKEVGLLIAERVIIHPDEAEDDRVIDRREVTRDADFKAESFYLVGEPGQYRGIVFEAERTEGSLARVNDVDVWDELPRAWHLLLTNHQLLSVEVDQFQAGQPSVRWVAGNVVREAVDPPA